LIGRLEPAHVAACVEQQEDRLADHQPVEQQAHRRQVLLDGGSWPSA
jgi:hypothetical protein